MAARHTWLGSPRCVARHDTAAASAAYLDGEAARAVVIVPPGPSPHAHVGGDAPVEVSLEG
eukprot:CAMPEP_0194328500 /NCGR_PEP_ID=MMETSP0171-20130528/45075_1 /TAXON_ID=218684 /ORGANISM="Corethron pennatum, Strain L29A3" /LENGTH=60 /DNA_ID=CAMNT_0039088881 /DNA_START=85 /DNA_END=263 /DNA_ORIENTATION=-